MNKEHLQAFVEQNPKLVKKTVSDKYPGLYVLKYTRKVFYDDLWSDELEYCRGTVVDKDFNLIAFPFQKIYNYGIESRAPVFTDNEQVTAFRKVNGFMVSLSYYDNDVLVSTTGSVDSDFVGMAKEMMLTHMQWEDWRKLFLDKEFQNMTFMFECCHPNDPHIIPEKSGMYILGYRQNDFESVVGHDPYKLREYGTKFKCFVSESVTTNMAQLRVLVKECRHEGYVFYNNDGVAAKIKSPYYLTAKWVARNPRTDKLLTKQFKEQIDEEYYGLLDHIRANIEEYTLLDEQARLVYVRSYMENL